MRNKVISILFCVMLAAGIGASAILPDRYYSESEKRTLKQFPSLTAEEIFDGKLGDEIEQYLAEQFPARDSWVTVKTLAELASGKREIGGVFFADDGYLIEAHKSLPSKQAKTNIAALKMLSDSLAKSNIEMRVILAPTTSQILSEKLPQFAPNANQSAVIEYARKQGLNVVDVPSALSEHKDEYIFYKTDHHWTSLGAYYAYAEWRRAKGETPEPIDAYFKREKHEVNYNNGEYVTDSIFEEKFLNGSDKYAVFFNSNQAVTKINGSGSGKILIIKDSYANCFGQFVVDDYAETHLIDLRFFTGKVTDYIRENGIAEVLVLYNIPNFSTDISAARCFR